MFFAFNEPVVRIEYEKDLVRVITKNNEYNSIKALITIPMGVLQSGDIQFVPEISEKVKAAKQLGFGPVVKTLFQFRKAFWKNKDHTQGKNLKKLSFVFARTIIPTWWTNYPKNSSMIIGWSGGPHANDLQGMSDEEIKEKGLQSLSSIFNIPQNELDENLEGWHIYNWLEDPYCKGGYSYDVVNGATLREIVKKPLLDTVFFSGEGLFDGIEIGTVEAALSTGMESAFQIISKL